MPADTKPIDLAGLRVLLSEMSPRPWALDPVDDDIVSAESVVVGYIYDGNDGNVMADRTADRDGVLAIVNAAGAMLDRIAALESFRSNVRALWFELLKGIAENEAYVVLPGAVGCDSLRSQNMAARAIADRLHILIDATAPLEAPRAGEAE